MTKTTEKTAATSKVKIGLLEIDGLMDEKGNYYIAVPQLAELIAVHPGNASRDFKALLCKDSQFINEFKYIKLKTPLNPKAVNAIPLKEFEILLAKLDRSGNTKAQELRDVMVGLSLHQLFCDAFNVKFEKDERYLWLKARMFTKETFWFMGDSICQYYLDNPRVEKYHQQNYFEAFDKLNVGLFGMKAKQIKKALGIGKNALTRNHFGEKSLKKIEMVQRIAEAQITYQGKNPVDAVDFAIKTMNYQIGDFRD